MKTIYSYGDESGKAFLLKKGTVHIEITKDEKIPLPGENLIVGAIEPLLEKKQKKKVPRIFSFYSDEDTDVAPVAVSVLHSLIPKFHIGFNLCFFLATTVKLTNEKYKKRIENKDKEQKEYNQNAVKYFTALSEIDGLAQKLRFPDLITLTAELRNELIYETGKILKQQEKTLFQITGDNQASNMLNENTVLCKEKEEGDELFILEQGTISVKIGDNEVAQIKEPGTVIGEMALFLGEVRTATLATLTKCRITKLKKADLESFCSTNKEFFPHIAQTLAGRINNNFVLIRAFDQQYAEEPHTVKESDKRPDFLKKKPGEDKLSNLFKSVSKLQKKKQFPQLKDFMTKYKSEIEHFEKNG